MPFAVNFKEVVLDMKAATVCSICHNAQLMDGLACLLSPVVVGDRNSKRAAKQIELIGSAQYFNASVMF
jgi:hypothetical protein